MKEKLGACNCEIKNGSVAISSEFSAYRAVKVALEKSVRDNNQQPEVKFKTRMHLGRNQTVSKPVKQSAYGAG